jgi:hypothetical protein
MPQSDERSSEVATRLPWAQEEEQRAGKRSPVYEGQKHFGVFRKLPGLAGLQ